MNPNTPPPSDDDLPDERELAALYARLPKAEPDPALDAAVLTQATRALPARRRPRWPVAIGSAAVLVLAVGVAWKVREVQPAITATLPAPAPSSGAEHERQADAAASATPSQGLQENVQVAKKPDASLAKATASGHVVSRALRTMSTAPVPMAAPVPATPSEPPAPTAPMPAAAPPLAAGDQAGSANTTQASGRAAAYLPKLDLGPDDRVGEIRRLLDRGRREEALLQLRELRERYPGYELPQDLRELKP